MNIERYTDPKYYIKLFTKFMIGLIVLRIFSIFYLVMHLEVQAGYWGVYQLPYIYPIYVVITVLCLVYLVRKDLQYLKILPLHIFTLLFMAFDITIYVISIGQAWDYWPF